MTEADFPIFSAKLLELAELYEKALSESQQLLYFDALADIDVEFVLGGILHSARTCKFFPRPAELRGFIQGDDDEHEERAWLEFKEKARAIGGYASPQFDDGALAQAIVSVFGSWEGACWADFTPEMWVAKRKEFGRVYRVMLNRGDAKPTTLAGFCARENGLRGYDKPPDSLPPQRDMKRLGEE